MRESDARVARGTFDHGASGFQAATALRIEHDRARGPILDRAAWIHELRLAIDLAAGLLAHVAQPNERGIAHRFEKILADPHRPRRSNAAAQFSNPLASGALAA